MLFVKRCEYLNIWTFEHSSWQSCAKTASSPQAVSRSIQYHPCASSQILPCMWTWWIPYMLLQREGHMYLLTAVSQVSGSHATLQHIGYQVHQRFLASRVVCFGVPPTATRGTKFISAGLSTACAWASSTWPPQPTTPRAMAWWIAIHSYMSSIYCTTIGSGGHSTTNSISNSTG